MSTPNHDPNRIRRGYRRTCVLCGKSLPPNRERICSVDCAIQHDKFLTPVTPTNNTIEIQIEKVNI